MMVERNLRTEIIIVVVVSAPARFTAYSMGARFFTAKCLISTAYLTKAKKQQVFQ